MFNEEMPNEWIESQLGKIPNKLSFRIGEVSKILSVKPYILRYWESEFSQLKPEKMDNKQRLYHHKDVETLLLIKKLLYEDGYSIKGAKQALKFLNKQLKDVKSERKFKERLQTETKNLLEQISRLKKLFK